MSPKTNTPSPSENSGDLPSQKPSSELPEKTGKRAEDRERRRKKKREKRAKEREERALRPPQPNLDWSAKVGTSVYSLKLLRVHDTYHMWCQCVCGKEKAVKKSSLKTGDAKSCGCQKNRYNVETRRQNHPNPICRTQEYRIYHQMKQRCLNPNDSAYKHYGGRGITICQRWLASYETFLKDMGPRPSKQYSVDRIDYNREYSPENCRWADRITQANNTRATSFLTLNGVTKCSTDWEAELYEKLGLTKQNIADRKHWGWSDERILTTPVARNKRTT